MAEALRCSVTLSGAEVTARDALLDQLIQARFASRLLARDETIFGPSAAEDVRTRMNWISAPNEASAVLPAVDRIRESLPATEKLSVLLCGMGGSSLGPQMLVRSQGGSLNVLETTFPADVATVLERVQDSLVVVSSKSGTTVETRSHLSAIEHRLRSLDIRPEERIVIITDPNTPLAQYAQKMRYTTVFADSHVGGRFSVFTAYGLIPAALTGIDVMTPVQEAVSAQPSLFADEVSNPALQLATAAVVRNRALYLPEKAGEPGFAAWLEQLIAESTGKNGKGVLPVPFLSDDAGGTSAPDLLELHGLLGARIMAWEVATAAMCWLLGVNPFDQPDVERSKQATRELLSSDAASTSSSEGSGFVTAAEAIELLSRAVAADDYVAVQYFGSSAERAALEQLRTLLEALLQVPVTVGSGPAYLHSTGQLHKGGPNRGVFLQVVPSSSEDVPIPEELFSFGELCRAQASGDAQILKSLGKPLARTTAGLHELIDEVATLL